MPFIVERSTEIILSWNGGAERLYGYGASEIIGQPVSMLVPTDRHQELQACTDRLLAGEGVDHFETVRLRRTAKRSTCPSPSHP